LWNIFNSRINKGESIRVFPLSNWTELDIWLYIQAENIPLSRSISRKNAKVVLRNGSIVLIHNAKQLLHGKNANAQVQDALAWLCAVHRGHPFGSGFHRDNY